MLPFLHVLQSVAAGATQEAQHSRQAFDTQMQEAVAAAEAGGLFVQSGEDDDGDSEDGSADESSSDKPAKQRGQPASHRTGAAAGRYFRKRLARQAARDQEGPQHPEPLPQQQQHRAAAAGVAWASSTASSQNFGPLPPAKRLRLPAVELEELDLTWRRAFSAASLASAAVDAAAPLLLQHNLRCAVLAVQVLVASLEALAAATEAVETEERLFEGLVDRGPDAALRPTRPAPAKLLPAVHTIWPLLLAALQDTGSVSLIEQQLGLMARMVQLAGGRFMARRFRQEAWPLLQRLLRAGPFAGAANLAAATAAGTVGGGSAAAALLGVGSGPGSETSTSSQAPHGPGLSGALSSALRSVDAASASSGGSWNEAQGQMVGRDSYTEEGGPLAPATLQRVQVAALNCLQGICSSHHAAGAVQGPLLWEVCVLAAPFLSDMQALALREAAARLLVAAADVDADAVWLLLLDLGSCYQDIAQLLPHAAQMQPADAAGRQPGVPGCGVAWPSPVQLLPSVTAAAIKGQGMGSALQQLLRSAAAVSCGKRAAALLPTASEASVAWHIKAHQHLELLSDSV